MVTDAVQTGVELHGRLFAIHEEHLPLGLQEQARGLVNDIVATTSDAALLQEARLYAALVEALPDHVSQIRAAFEATIFEGSVKGDEDWWERFRDQP